MVEPPVSYLESTVPVAVCEIALPTVLVLLAERYLVVYCPPPALSPSDCHCYNKKKGYYRRIGRSRYSEWLPKGGAPGRI
jgi:hypothetical protein